RSLTSTLSLFYCYAHPPDLHSFPTRRSSDLRITVPRQCADLLAGGRFPESDRVIAASRGQGLAVGGNRHRINIGRMPQSPDFLRSEEHTSELQSRRDLVCRLLLEKKKRVRAENSSTYGSILLSNSPPAVTSYQLHPLARHSQARNTQRHTTHTHA